MKRLYDIFLTSVGAKERAVDAGAEERVKPDAGVDAGGRVGLNAGGRAGFKPGAEERVKADADVGAGGRAGLDTGGRAGAGFDADADAGPKADAKIGTNVGTKTVTDAGAGVATDSRSVTPGALFFALRGENFDGNRFAAEALAKGAAYAVVDDPRVAADDRYLVVDDVLLTLQRLAAHHRRTLGIPILAITGTNGKTTTKELIARVLASKFEVSVTRGNLNNHIGVPLTLLAMTRDTRFGVVEMGASAVGEIAALCEIAAPDFGLITNVGRAHLEGFGDFDGVRRAKGELYDYLAAHGGTAFVAEDDDELPAMAAMRPALKTATYTLAAADGIKNPLEGDYNTRNIAAAVAVGRYFDVNEAHIKGAIESFRCGNNRSQLVVTARNTLVLDCYNANPSSMRAAITAFARTPSSMAKAVILGDMMELGAFSPAEHEAILTLLETEGLNDIYLVGGNFIRALRDYPAMPREVRLKSFADTDELAAYLSANPVSGRRILIKGSRSVGLEKIAHLLD